MKLSLFFLILVGLLSSCKKDNLTPKQVIVCGAQQSAGFISANTDYGFVVAGQKTLANQDVLMMSFDDDLQKTSETILDFGENETATSISSEPPNSLLILGHQQPLIGGKTKALLLATSLIGNILFKKTVSFDGFSLYPSGLTISPTGNIYAVGTAIAQQNGIRQNWVAVFDANGNLINQRVSGSTKFCGYSDVEAYGDSVFVYGYKQDILGNRDFTFSKLNPELAIVWSKTFGGKGYQESHEMISTQAGHFFLVGHSADADPLHNMCIYKVDRKGKVLFYQEFGGNRHDGGEAICIDQFGNVVIGGRTNSFEEDLQKAMLVWVGDKGNSTSSKLIKLGYDLKTESLLINNDDLIFIGSTQKTPNSPIDLVIRKYPA